MQYFCVVIKRETIINNLNNMGDMKNLVRKFEGLSYTQWLNKLGISYLGSYCASAKEIKSLRSGCLTYMLYLAPSNLSGYQTCPNDKYCKDLCLNRSGQNRLQTVHSNKLDEGLSKTDKSRIKKTKLFYENRELFMFLLCHEIERFYKKAKDMRLSFAVRLNGTSDLSPELFKVDNMCILNYYKDIQFYDYTKVPNRINLISKYNNYDLTLSYNGYNWDTCKKFLDNGGKVAVVFDGKMPRYFNGYKVNDANNYDMRFLDNPSEICGLTFHRVASCYDNEGNYIGIGDTKFVVRENENKESDKFNDKVKKFANIMLE